MKQIGFDLARHERPLLLTAATLPPLGLVCKSFADGSGSPLRVGEDRVSGRFFNLLNHVNFAAAQNRTFAGRWQGESPRSNVGQIDSTIAPSRQIQLALRLEF